MIYKVNIEMKRLFMGDVMFECKFLQNSKLSVNCF
jgi:hypothetical protein